MASFGFNLTSSYTATRGASAQFLNCQNRSGVPVEYFVNPTATGAPAASVEGMVLAPGDAHQVRLLVSETIYARHLSGETAAAARFVVTMI